LVSVVVPCYNYGRFLPECLASIFGQQDIPGVELEVIAIDDASDDNTADILRSVQDSRLHVISHSKNRGHVFTVNEGLTEARGEFIARIDPDDRYRPYFLSAALGKFREFPEVGLVYGDAALMDETGRVNVQTSDVVHDGRDFVGNEFVALLELNFICAPTALGRRDAWRKALPIPDGLAFNDWYFNLMMARNYDFCYVNRVFADYRVHATNHHTKIVKDKSEESSIFRLLDRFYSEVESEAELERAKRRAKGRVFGANYLALADKYFGARMNLDAHRCYRSAVRHRPSYLLSAGVQRRLAAMIIGRERYESGKALVKSRLARG